MQTNGKSPDSVLEHPVGLLVQSLMSDPQFRSQISEDPYSALSAKGLDVPADVQVEVAVNTDKVFHVVMPADPNIMLSDEALDMVAGGKTAGTGGSASSAGSFGCLCTTASTAGSGATASTVGSAS